MTAMSPSSPNPLTRRSIEDEIERLIALLDAVDGDADLEGADDHEADVAQLDCPGFIWRGGEGGGAAQAGC